MILEQWILFSRPSCFTPLAWRSSHQHVPGHLHQCPSASRLFGQHTHARWLRFLWELAPTKCTSTATGYYFLTLGKCHVLTMSCCVCFHAFACVTMLGLAGKVLSAVNVMGTSNSEWLWRAMYTKPNGFLHTLLSNFPSFNFSHPSFWPGDTIMIEQGSIDSFLMLDVVLHNHANIPWRMLPYNVDSRALGCVTRNGMLATLWILFWAHHAQCTPGAFYLMRLCITLQG